MPTPSVSDNRLADAAERPIRIPWKEIVGIASVLCLLLALLAASLAGIVYSVHRMWDDRRDRTGEQVILALREQRAAEQRRREELVEAMAIARRLRLTRPVKDLDEALRLAENGDEIDRQRVLTWMATFRPHPGFALDEQTRLLELLTSASDLNKASKRLLPEISQAWVARIEQERQEESVRKREQEERELAAEQERARQRELALRNAPRPSVPRTLPAEPRYRAEDLLDRYRRPASDVTSPARKLEGEHRRQQDRIEAFLERFSPPMPRP